MSDIIRAKLSVVTQLLAVDAEIKKLINKPGGVDRLCKKDVTRLYELQRKMMFAAKHCPVEFKIVQKRLLDGTGTGN